MGKKKHEEHENLERWLVSYADFITLLFAFFVVLYALGQTEKREYKDAIISIQRAFLSGGGVFPLKGYPFTPFEKALEKGHEVPPTADDMGRHTKANSRGDIGGEGKGAELEKVAENIRGLYEKSTGLSLQATDVNIVPSKDGFRIRLNEKLLFKPGSTKIKRQNVPFLYEMGRRLNRLQFEVQVEGHSDSEGSKKKNYLVSSERAYNVMQFFIEATDFPKDLISMASYGDTKPLSESSSRIERAKNRRVEIAVISEDADLTELPW